jgi:LPXTG-site transpeptidase (sortase) family protein
VGALSQSGQPARLIIPSLEIDAPIEVVERDDQSIMAAPSSVEKVAWYNLGPRPGEPGNAVIAGHLDDVRGRPAVFWSLDELAAGDEIIVRYADKSEIHFEVLEVETYDADAAPMERIFGVDFNRDLNLITCDGEWNAQSKLYDRRLVVYARRVEDDASRVSAESSVATKNLARAAATLAAANTLVADEVAPNVAPSQATVEYMDDSTQSYSTPTSHTPPSPGATHAR